RLLPPYGISCSRRSPASRLLLASFRPRLPQRLQLFADLRFHAVRCRRVELGADQRIGQALLIQRDAALYIGVVLITLAVAEPFHQPGRRVAKMHRYLQRAALTRVG